MPKIDKLKEEIGWLKVVFGILVAIDISLVAWLVQNFTKTDTILIVFSVLAVLFVTGIVVWVNRMAYRKIDDLGDL